MGLILVISLIMKYSILVSKGHLVYNLNFFSSQFSLELIKKKSYSAFMKLFACYILSFAPEMNFPS